MLESDEWKSELAVNFWASAYKGSVELRKFMARDNEGVEVFFSELGLAR